MTLTHVVIHSLAYRRGMLLARHRGDSGSETHVVDTTRSKSSKEEQSRYRKYRPSYQSSYWNDRDLVLADLTNEEDWYSLCGKAFPPGSVEPVQWGTGWPHRRCIKKAHVPLSVILREHRITQDMRLRHDTSPQEIDAAIALLQPIFADRGTDWTSETEDGHPYWTHESSFNSKLPGERIQPRGIDIGLERLGVEIPYPGTVHIHSCGVRDGCPRHIAHTETFPLNHIDAIAERISALETAATSIALDELAWCMFAGDCSTAYDYGD